MSTSTAAPTLVERADERALAEAARKVEAVGGSVKLVSSVCPRKRNGKEDWAMKIKVSVPATSANVGSGFDALGLAVTLYNTVTFEESEVLEISACGRHPHPPRRVEPRVPLGQGSV